MVLKLIYRIYIQQPKKEVYISAVQHKISVKGTQWYSYDDIPLKPSHIWQCNRPP